MVRQRVVLLPVVMWGLVLLGAVVGCASKQSVPSGHYERGSLSADGEVYHYKVYIPRNWRPGSALPLIVVLHGCSETANAVAAAADYGPVADRHRFMVLYPGVDAIDEAQYDCWRAIWDPSSEGRGRGDAGAIAAMTRRVIGAWRIDRRRVYAIGISAGAFETAVLGAAYPDLYAAIGIHSGAAYMGGQPGCLTEGESPASLNTVARTALTAMGARHHLMPVIVFHGYRDGRVPYACGREAVEQWLRTDDLILEHEGRAPLPAAPTSVSSAIVRGGHGYTVDSYADPAGCTVVQFWTIRGMGHFWSGGSASRSSARYSDPRGPSAAAASWAFFSRWRLSRGVDSCTRSDQ